MSSGFPHLFGEGDQGSEGPEDEEGAEGAAEGGGGFVEKWGWIANVDLVAETMRRSWDEVLAGTAVEFLNVICYARDKARHERDELDKWKRTH